MSASETVTEPLAEEIAVALPSALFRAATYAPSLTTTLPSPAVAWTVSPLSATSFVPVPVTTTPFLSVVPSSPFAVTVAVPDAATLAPPCTTTASPAAIERFAAVPETAPVSSSTAPALTTAPFTSTAPVASSVTPPLPDTSVRAPVPFAAVALPETYAATEPSAVTAAPFWAVNEPERVAESPTSTSPFAATIALSTMTAPAASMSTFAPASTFAPPCAVTDAPSSLVVASDATLAALSARIAPVVFTVRSPFATSSLPLTVSEAVVPSLPTSSVEADATLDPPFTSTAPPSASIVIAPLEARIEPPTSTPSAPASTSTAPDAPAFAPFCTFTPLLAVITRFALSPSAITGLVSPAGVSNLPALTSAPLAVSVPIVTLPLSEVSVTPSPPTTCVSTMTFFPSPVDFTDAVVAAVIPLTCVSASVWLTSVTSSVPDGHFTSVTLRSASGAVADLTVTLPEDSTSTFPPVDLYATSTSVSNVNLMSFPDVADIFSALTSANDTPPASLV